MVALHAVGIDAAVRPLKKGGAGDSPQADAVLDVTVDDRVFPVTIQVVSYCTGQVALRVVSRAATAGGSALAARGGPDHRRGPERSSPTPAGRGSTAVANCTCAVPACASTSRCRRLCAGSLYRSPCHHRAIGHHHRANGLTTAHPGQSLSPNRNAAGLRLAPSTISTTVRRLAEAGLVDDTGRLVSPPNCSGSSPPCGAASAPGYSAVPTRSNTSRSTPLRRCRGESLAPPRPWHMERRSPRPGRSLRNLYATGPVELSIASASLTARQHPGAGSAVIAVPPTSLVTERNKDDVIPEIDRWPAAPLVAVVLDVAQDTGRGRVVTQAVERRTWHWL